MRECKTSEKPKIKSIETGGASMRGSETGGISLYDNQKRSNTIAEEILNQIRRNFKWQAVGKADTQKGITAFPYGIKNFLPKLYFNVVLL